MWSVEAGRLRGTKEMTATQQLRAVTQEHCYTMVRFVIVNTICERFLRLQQHSALFAGNAHKCVEKASLVSKVIKCIEQATCQRKP